MADAASDWHFKIYRADANGQATGGPVGQSAQGSTNFKRRWRRSSSAKTILPDLGLTERALAVDGDLGF